MSSPIEAALSEIKSKKYLDNKEKYESGQAMKKMKKTLTPEEEGATAPMSFKELVERNSQRLSDDYSERSRATKQKRSSGFSAPYEKGAVIGSGSGA